VDAFGVRRWAELGWFVCSVIQRGHGQLVVSG